MTATGGMKQALPGKRCDYFQIPRKLLKIVTDRSHYLYSADVEDPLDPRFVRRIAKQGIRVPVIVTKDGADLLIVDGRSRVRAVDEINVQREAEGLDLIETIPCVPAKGNEGLLLEVMADANLARKVERPSVRALKAAAYLGQGHSREEAMELFDVSGACLVNWLKFAELGLDLQRAVHEGKLPMSTAIRHHGKSFTEQKAALADELAAKGKPKSKAPPKRRMALAVNRLGVLESAHSEAVILALRWAMGEVSDKALVKFFGEVLTPPTMAQGEN